LIVKKAKNTLTHTKINSNKQLTEKGNEHFT